MAKQGKKNVYDSMKAPGAPYQTCGPLPQLRKCGGEPPVAERGWPMGTLQLHSAPSWSPGKPGLVGRGRAFEKLPSGRAGLNGLTWVVATFAGSTTVFFFWPDGRRRYGREGTCG